MSTDAIDKWLKAPDYDSGVEILRTFLTNRAKLYFYENKVYKLPALIKEIRAISVDLQKEPGKDSLGNRIVAKEVAFKRENKKLPPHIIELKKSADRAWKEARDLQSTIITVRSKKKRFLMAKRVLELVPFAFEQWRNVEQYETTGDLSFMIKKEDSTFDVNKMTLMEMLAASKNIPGYITKFKNQLVSANGKEKTDYLMKMIAEKEAQLASINNRFQFLNDKIIELCL